MNVKKIFLAALASLIATATPHAETTTPPFEYPVAPDSIETLQDRVSYVMHHFFDRADMKKLAADTAAMRVAVADFIGFIPYAHADTVRHTISRLMATYAGQPATLLHIADIAEERLVGPQADFWSETTYLNFLRPVLSDKKVKAKDKQPLLDQIKKFNSSTPGAVMQNFSYTTRHGAKHSLYDETASTKIILLEPDDCRDCSLDRLRLKADAALSQLVKDNQVKLYLIRPGKIDEQWNKTMEDLPFGWEVGSSDDISTLVDTRLLPYVYVLDRDNKILMRKLSTDQILNLAGSLYRQN